MSDSAAESAQGRWRRVKRQRPHRTTDGPWRYSDGSTTSGRGESSVRSLPDASVTHDTPAENADSSEDSLPPLSLLYSWSQSVNSDDERQPSDVQSTCSSSRDDSDCMCPICYEDASSVSMQTTPCNHSLCSSCLDRILETKPLCPFCRTRLGPDPPHLILFEIGDNALQLLIFSQHIVFTPSNILAEIILREMTRRSPVEEAPPTQDSM